MSSTTIGRLAWVPRERARGRENEPDSRARDGHSFHRKNVGIEIHPVAEAAQVEDGQAGRSVARVELGKVAGGCVAGPLAGAAAPGGALAAVLLARRRF